MLEDVMPLAQAWKLAGYRDGNALLHRIACDPTAPRIVYVGPRCRAVSRSAFVAWLEANGGNVRRNAQHKARAA